MGMRMTDLEKLKALLDEFGVGYSCQQGTRDFATGHSLSCDQGNAKVDGYYGFCTEFEFCADGRFVRMGAFEG